MSALSAHRPMTITEFLPWVEDVPGRWELIEGVPVQKGEPLYDSQGNFVMMAPARPWHGRLQGNLYAALKVRLRPPCIPYQNASVTILGDETSWLEPDNAVSCSVQPPDTVRLVDPVLIGEILSVSTERRDGVQKAPLYRAIPTVQCVLHLRQDRPSALLSTREGTGWREHPPFGPGAVLTLPFLGDDLPLDELYS